MKILVSKGAWKRMGIGGWHGRIFSVPDVEIVLTGEAGLIHHSAAHTIGETVLRELFHR
jgi:hypothetical protein